MAAYLLKFILFGQIAFRNRLCVESRFTADGNLLLGKNTKQSSTSSAKWSESWRAVDGSTYAQHNGGRCTQTEPGFRPWLLVETKTAYDIHSVEITNRADDCCVHYLSDFTIKVGMHMPSTEPLDTSEFRLCAKVGRMAKGATERYRCSSGTTGRVIVIQLNQQQKMRILSLCEVKAFGLVARGGWSGWTPWDRCSRRCGVGTHKRTRSCSNPPPPNKHVPCFGKNNETESCWQADCAPVSTTPAPGWSSWFSWGGCSVTCGAGTQRRQRSCDRSRVRCPGSNMATRICRKPICKRPAPSKFYLVLSKKV